MECTKASRALILWRTRAGSWERLSRCDAGTLGTQRMRCCQGWNLICSPETCVVSDSLMLNSNDERGGGGRLRLAVERAGLDSQDGTEKE